MPPKDRLARGAAPFVHAANEEDIHRLSSVLCCAYQFTRTGFDIKPLHGCVTDVDSNTDDLIGRR